MVSFTGSHRGRHAASARSAGRTLKRQLLELGGKGAALVFDDADVKTAIGMIGSVWTFHSGQICTAPTRAIVHRSIYDQVVEGLAKMATVLKVGDPLEARHRRRARSSPRRTATGSRATSQSGRDEGGEIVAGGGRPAHLEQGLVRRADAHRRTAGRDMRVVQEEIFGPVIVAIPFDDDDEGIAIANGTEFGLYDYVFSGDTARAMRVSPPAAGRQRRDQHGAAQPGDAVRRHEAQRHRARRRLVRPPRVHRAPVRRLARLHAEHAADEPSTAGVTMEFGIFHSGHVPTQAIRTRSAQLEHRRLLDEVEVAVTGRPQPASSTRWFTEHHFLEEYSHVSASEVLMGYVAARTERSTSARGSSTSRRR